MEQGEMAEAQQQQSCGTSTDNNDNNSDSDDGEWTLQIKTVGEQHQDFCVTVHPEDPLQKLRHEIRQRTGWSDAEQRLIYRGRLLGNKGDDDEAQEESSSTTQKAGKVRDIVGLTDGHTIHLMRKQIPRVETETNSSTESNTTPGDTTPTSETNNGASSSPSSSLLAALLGVGTGTASSDRSSNRRAPFRLQEADLVRPDPGSMESVRQGLLTLHTVNDTTRQFYLGQWIDCRDTVNQWLEATVVDIVYPYELFPEHYDEEPDDTNTAAATPTTDPAIAVTDLDGRRRLLLEHCQPDESEEQLEDGVYYRRRSNNESVQLLHIHYNGWPVRWDEWIRSDSERIRPFRTRTRHSGPYASPVVATALPDPPSTLLTHNEATDRQALLPELHRAVSRVNDLLERAAAVAATVEPREHLPWQPQQQEQEQQPSRSERQRQLAALAPLLDRLGRILTDAAPQVAAAAACEEEEEEEEEDESESSSSSVNPSTLGGLLSLLSRDRARSHEQSVASSNAAVPSVSAASLASGNEHSTVAVVEVDPDLVDYTSGFVNTTRGELRTGPRGSRNNSGGASSSDDVASLLGAYLAAASLGGFTSIGGGGGDGDNDAAAEGLGRLLRDRGNGGIDIHIHAVVTTPVGGTGMPAGTATPPVPITGGGGGGGGGLGALFALSPRDSPRRNGSRRFRSSNASASSQASLPSVTTTTTEDDGIFAELYSDNPDPINHNRLESATAEGSSQQQQPQAPDSPQRASSTVMSAPAEGSNDLQTSARRSSRRRDSRSSSSSRTGGSNGVLGRFFRRNNTDRSNH